ncbi:protein O-linked-mannose beta-1,2-N-acetylglucosaminyltransferase 1-like [Octopus vulgaris]|uniref:Protein O-linked-mannose beta-1,2-N-acetylglucosaminyltransferase 1-like n=1 Tax=Octopus vulgaris TaxID=6645 RepID=A0AA36BH26_OCTVU|nr:protein O-linked-mannose beta-1,2-N-acetylglucosaminyltransferase 1-like [Octopus vulgaris]
MLRYLRRLFLRHLVNYKLLLLCSLVVVGFFYFLNSDSVHGKHQVWDIINTTANKCIVSCPRNQFSFYIKSGEGIKSFPIICFNNKEYVSAKLKNAHRGLNGLFINGKTKAVIGTRYFDTYNEDYSLIRYLKRTLPDETVVIFASHDEMTSNLRQDCRNWLRKYGSNLIDKANFRDNFIMIGQRGLKSGNAIEFLKSNKRNFAGAIEKSGCFDMPMGPIQPVPSVVTEILTGGKILHGESIANCGMENVCPDDSFSVHLYTGKENLDYPKICADERLLMAKGLNHAGRGMNIVVYDPQARKVKYVANFDTYKEDSTDFEIFLEELPTSFIIMVVVWDDAAIKLGQNARQLLNDYGSSMIQNLKFRDVWYFIGQKKIEGFSTFEQISYAKPDSGWPSSLQLFACVPFKMQGTKVRPDPMAYRNDQRREFCTKYEGYVDFCDIGHIDDIIKPVSLVYSNFKGHKIFSTPIVIIPGINHNAVVNTFQTIIMQCGLNPKMVLVCWDEKFQEYSELAELFGFQNRSLTSSTKYTDVMMKAIDMAWNVFPDSDHIIFIEEELLLSPDFLFFMAQSMPILEQDSSLLAISAWNYNGYEATSENSSLLYRVEDFPSLGFMLKKEVYKKYMQGKLDACCNKRIWDGWHIQNISDGEVIIPDVSRVYRQPFLTATNDEDYVKTLFHQPRTTNLEQKVKLFNVNSLGKNEYEMAILKLLRDSEPLTDAFFLECLKNSVTQTRFQFPKQRQYYSVYYAQENAADFTVLTILTKCFGLSIHDKRKPNGLHKGLLRFTHQGYQLSFVGQYSSYFYLKPMSVTVITREALTKPPT